MKIHTTYSLQARPSKNTMQKRSLNSLPEWYVSIVIRTVRSGPSSEHYVQYAEHSCTVRDDSPLALSQLARAADNPASSSMNFIAKRRSPDEPPAQTTASLVIDASCIVFSP